MLCQKNMLFNSELSQKVLKDRFSLASYVCSLLKELGGGRKTGFGQKRTLQIFNRVEMGFVTTTKS